MRKLIVACGCTLLCSLSAMAQVPPPATFSLYAGSQSSTNPGTLNSTDPSGGNASATITLGPDPYLSVSAHIAGPPTFQPFTYSAEASYIFYFEVTGSSGTVPISVSASGTLGGTGGGSGGQVALYINQLGASTGSEFIASIPPNGGSLSVNQDVNVPVNTIQEVQMLTIVDVEGGTGVPNQGSASLDPLIAIDPSFANAAGYTLTFSPNFLPVPEPSTISLACLGALALASRIRRSGRL